MLTHIIAKCGAGRPWGPGIKTFHYRMFHGLGERTGSPFHVWESYFLEEDTPHALHVIHNAFQMPDVFMPHLHYVVSERVRLAMAGCRNVRFLKVVFDKVFTHEWHVGDLSFYDNHAGENVEEEFMRGMPMDKEAMKKIGDFYEVIPVNHDTIKGNFPERRVMSGIYLGPTDWSPKFAAELCGRMVEEFPVIYVRGDYVLSHDVFARISDFFDWRFYVKADVEM
jgi:hypothetical protein